MDRKLAGRILLVIVSLLIVSSGAFAQTNALNFKEADLRDVLHTLGELASVNVAADPQVQGTVTMFLQGLAPLDAIDLVVRTNGYDYLWVENTIVVGLPETLSDRFEPTNAVFFPLEYVEANEIASALSLVVQPATVQPDSVHRGVLVRGTEEQLAKARRFLAERDSKRELEFDFKDAELLTVFHALAQRGGYSLLLDTPLYGTLTILLQGIEVDEAIDLAARQSGVEYHFEGNSLVVRMDPPEEPTRLVDGDEPAPSRPVTPVRTRRPEEDDEPRETRVFKLHYIESDSARSVVARMASHTRLEVEDVDDSLFARGTEAELQLVDELLDQFDVPRVRLDGVVVQAEQRLAVLTVGTRSYVVKQGDSVRGLEVVEVSNQSAALRTARGHIMRVTIGGSE